MEKNDSISRAEVLKLLERENELWKDAGHYDIAKAIAEVATAIERMPSVGENDERRATIWEAACRAQQLQDAAFVAISLDWKQAWLAPMPEDDLSQPSDPIVADPSNLKE